MVVVELDFELKSTTGFTADCDRAGGAGGGAGGRAAGAAATAVACETAGAETCVVDLLTVRVVFWAGFAAADLTCLTVLTVFVAEVRAGALASAAVVGAELLADGAGALDVFAGALSVGVGVEAAGGAESAGTGWDCCASPGVAESARTAAIAGRALARGYLRVIFIMRNNRRV